MHKPRLTDSVSVQELYYMRESGLRNSEIAERLETTTETIRKYIGPDGTRGKFKRPKKGGDNPEVEDIRLAIQRIKNLCMKIVNECNALEAEHGISIIASPDIMGSGFINDRGEVHTANGGMNVQVFAGGELLASALKAESVVTHSYGHRWFRFINDGCLFTQMSEMDGRFKKAERNK